jgi:anti-sigma regulatory factor (Ser/Thr protein kinase)
VAPDSGTRTEDSPASPSIGLGHAGGKNLVTTHLADQGCTRSTPVAAIDQGHRLDARIVLEESLKRHPRTASGGLPPGDAVWPQRLRGLLRTRLSNEGCTHLSSCAELLLTELVTNALRHTTGPKILVRVALRAGKCWIGVNDGCPRLPQPRDAGPHSETGRGLFLVGAMADSWGVSPDGKTTWCTLSSAEDVPETVPVVDIVKQAKVPVTHSSYAGGSARIAGRTLLTRMGWSGPQNTAVDVLYVLVQNAVQHGLPKKSVGKSMDVWFRITSANELLIDVKDTTAGFPDFEAAIRGELGRGLWGAQRLGAVISWFPENDGKVVRATLTPGPVDL